MRGSRPPHLQRQRVTVRRRISDRFTAKQISWLVDACYSRSVSYHRSRSAGLDYRKTIVGEDGGTVVLIPGGGFPVVGTPERLQPFRE